MANIGDSGAGVNAPRAATAVGELRELITDALRYWEVRRLFYNGLLGTVVVGHFVARRLAPAAACGRFCLRGGAHPFLFGRVVRRRSESLR